MNLEDALDVELLDEDLKNLETLNDVKAYLLQRYAARKTDLSFRSPSIWSGSGLSSPDWPCLRDWLWSGGCPPEPSTAVTWFSISRRVCRVQNLEGQNRRGDSRI